jgi:flagella basal body P-ring formation protein FlgA
MMASMRDGGGARFPFLGFALLCFGLSCSTGELQADEAKVLPVPRVMIYPGDIIKDEWVIERDVAPAAGASRAAIALSRADIVGKRAKRSLLPGGPVPLNALATPALVTKGAKVRIIFQQGGLSITAHGTALQAGALGEFISVRNLDSGLTISGQVEPDGSVRVGGG